MDSALIEHLRAEAGHILGIYDFQSPAKILVKPLQRIEQRLVTEQHESVHSTLAADTTIGTLCRILARLVLSDHHRCNASRIHAKATAVFAKLLDLQRDVQEGIACYLSIAAVSESHPAAADELDLLPDGYRRALRVFERFFGPTAGPGVWDRYSVRQPLVYAAAQIALSPLCLEVRGAEALETVSGMVASDAPSTRLERILSVFLRQLPDLFRRVAERYGEKAATTPESHRQVYRATLDDISAIAAECGIAHVIDTSVIVAAANDLVARMSKDVGALGCDALDRVVFRNAEKRPAVFNAAYTHVSDLASPNLDQMVSKFVGHFRRASEARLAGVIGSAADGDHLLLVTVWPMASIDAAGVATELTVWTMFLPYDTSKPPSADLREPLRVHTSPRFLREEIARSGSGTNIVLKIDEMFGRDLLDKVVHTGANVLLLLRDQTLQTICEWIREESRTARLDVWLVHDEDFRSAVFIRRESGRIYIATLFPASLWLQLCAIWADVEAVTLGELSIGQAHTKHDRLLAWTFTCTF